MASTTLLLSTTTLLLLLATTTSTVIDLPLHHYSYTTTPTPPTATSPLDTVLLLSRKDPSRIALILSASLVQAKSDVPIASGQQVTQSPSYVLRSKLGSPPQPLFLVFDTSSDLAFIPTSPSASPTPFNLSNSTTFSIVPCSSSLCTSPSSATCPATCSFTQSYGSDSFNAYLASDVLALGPHSLSNYTFAAVGYISGPGTSFPKQGLLGLGRGPASLMAQAPILAGIFSYCLPSFTSYYFTGSLRLGPSGQPQRLRYTPLLRNPHRSSLYYVNLTGISVGKTLLTVAPESLAFDPTTGAGTVIDSGTVISRFVEPVYDALRDEFRRQVGAPEYTTLGAFETCFATNAGGPATPSVTLHFQGMDLVLPTENTLIHSSARPLACLAMAASPANVNSVLNVIANLQQQNLRVVFDGVNGRVGFARELCN